jgi:hypothetical protein
VILALPIAFVAMLITTVPLVIVQHLFAFSSGWFAFLAVCLAAVLYWNEMWIRAQIKKFLESIA